MGKLWAMDLNAYLRTEKLTNAAFGELIGMGASSVWKLRNGKTEPSLRIIQEIERATGGKVTAMDFTPRPKIVALPEQSCEAA